MCPLCLTTAAIAIAKVVGAGGGATALAVKVKRRLARKGRVAAPRESASVPVDGKEEAR
jgi:hypothetical protein